MGCKVGEIVGRARRPAGSFNARDELARRVEEDSAGGCRRKLAGGGNYVRSVRDAPPNDRPAVRRPLEHSLGRVFAKQILFACLIHRHGDDPRPRALDAHLDLKERYGSLGFALDWYAEGVHNLFSLGRAGSRRVPCLGGGLGHDCGGEQQSESEPNSMSSQNDVLVHEIRLAL